MRQIYVFFVKKRARNRPNLLRGVLAAAPSAGASAGCAVSVGAASAAVAPLRRRRNILRSLSRFLSRAGESAGAVAGVGADSFSFPVKTKAAIPARTVKASTWLASTDGGGGARALARALKSKTPAVTPSRGNGLKSSSRVDFSMGVGFAFGLVGRAGLRGTTMGCPLPDQTTVPGLGATGFLAAGFLTPGFFTAGFLTAGFLTAGFLTAGFFTAGFLTAGFFTAGLFGTGFLAMGVLTAEGARFLAAGFLRTVLVARFLGAALPPENIAGHTAACGRTTAVVILPPAGTCHADTVETRTSSSTPVPDERIRLRPQIAIESKGTEGGGRLMEAP